jgi:serine/threonine protein kinase
MSSFADDTYREPCIEPLPRGTLVRRFEITGYLGRGGFSIVYEARDTELDRKIALKEFAPSEDAMRVNGTQVVPVSELNRPTFEIGLRSFINEGKLLARFNHPSLAQVYEPFKDHGTAYMAMPLYQGITFEKAARQSGQPPTEQWLLEVLDHITAALQVMHREHCFHRDIAPDNIMMLQSSGKPLLLDFGAARLVVGDQTRPPTAILKAGFAPAEQYASDPDLKQGPWTDIYAIGAVVYWAITGLRPAPSVDRKSKDTYVPLVQCAQGQYSERLLRAVDRALKILPDQRPQTIEEFRAELGLTGEPSQAGSARGRRAATAVGNNPTGSGVGATWS